MSANRQTMAYLAAPGAALLSALLLAGCAGTGPTVFTHREYDFSRIERVAVIPFENLSTDQGAGARVTRLFLSELLAAEAFDVVEPGDVSGALAKYNTARTADLAREQIAAVGKELGVQALIFGTVSESAGVRSAARSTSSVTLVVRMVEAEEGQTLWSATDTESGGGFWSSLFGTEGDSPSETARKAVRRVIRTLIH